jgi:hypothetical protein
MREPVEQDIPIEHIKVPDWSREGPVRGPQLPVEQAKPQRCRAFPRLIVSMRSDGECVLIDGRTRLEMMWRHRVPIVPCLVFFGLTPQEEAQKFIEVNSSAHPLDADAIADAIARAERARD